jgi:hypothetical protein
MTEKKQVAVPPEGAIRLEQWAVVFMTADPFVPPEAQLTGVRATLDDGAVVVVPGPGRVDGRLLRPDHPEYAGKVYWLGEPEPGYRKWLDANRPGWSPDNPIPSRRS